MAKAMQDLGFTLDEIVDALHSHGTCETERWRLEAVVERLDAKIAELRRARHNAVRTLRDCQAGQCTLKPADEFPAPDRSTLRDN